MNEEVANQTSDIITSEIQIMEVHHHPNLHHKRKNFREYFLEFLMIFLAVTLGFFAENYREHLSDASKEKEYMKSMVFDLKYDTAQYTTVLGQIIYICSNLDSCYMNIVSAPAYNYTLQGRWYYNIWLGDYAPALTTIQQLQSSGNLRLIQNAAVSRQLVTYESIVQGVVAKDQTGHRNSVLRIYESTNQFCNMGNMATKTFKGGDFPADNMLMIIKDKLKLNEYANEYILYKGHLMSYYGTVEGLKDKAIQLLTLIQKEYHLQ